MSRRASVRQLLVGAVALPLSILPFAAYLNFTPEGRLVRDRAVVALFAPTLPTLTPAQRAHAQEHAPRYREAVMALAYHGIGSASDGEGGFVVSPARFGEHLATLRAAGMHTVTAREVADAITAGAMLPPNAVMISFDDGRTDAMLFADPLLRQAGMKATMFVIADAAGHPGIYYASWNRLESAARSGRWDIESHSAALHREQDVARGVALPAMTSLAPSESLAQFRERIRHDLRTARSAIISHMGRPPAAFAYPFGAYGADRTNDSAIKRIVREEVARVHAIAFHQDGQDSMTLVTRGQNRTGLRRLEVGNWTGAQLLAQIGRAAARTDLSSDRRKSQVSPPGPGPQATGDVSELAAPTSVGTNPPTVPDAGASPGSKVPHASVLPTLTLPTIPMPTAPLPTLPLPTAPLPTVPLPTVSTMPLPLSPPTTVAPPPATRPPPTPPPTAPAGNCGGQAHGHACKK